LTVIKTITVNINKYFLIDMHRRPVAERTQDNRYSRAQEILFKYCKSDQLQ
jgi:hypothetical protein